MRIVGHHEEIDVTKGSRDILSRDFPHDYEIAFRDDMFRLR